MNKLFALGVTVLFLVVGAGTEWGSARGAARVEDEKKIQDSARVERKGTIPKGYKTYSLFLICNPQWLEHRQGDKNSDQLNQLYQQFHTFGRTIGSDNVAVWFWISGPATTGTDPRVEDPDVERSVRFCQAWHLKPSAGPHIVVTTTYPVEADLSSGIPKDSAVFELGNMESKEISKLLAKLTDELVEKGHVESTPEAPEARWVRLLGAVQQTINKFGCAWSFKIDAGPVKADLQSCKS
jgi:hypothetical protein